MLLQSLFKKTKKQIILIMKKLENYLAGIIIGGLVCMIIFAFTSCSSSKYGCGSHGRKGYNGRSITGFRKDF